MKKYPPVYDQELNLKTTNYFLRFIAIQASVREAQLPCMW